MSCKVALDHFTGRIEDGDSVRMVRRQPFQCAPIALEFSRSVAASDHVVELVVLGFVKHQKKDNPIAVCLHRYLPSHAAPAVAHAGAIAMPTTWAVEHKCQQLPVMSQWL